MAILVHEVLGNTTEFTVTTATPFDSAAGEKTIVLTQLTPGYILGGKKHQQVGAQAEPAFKDLPIMIPQSGTGATDRVRIKLTEITGTAPFVEDPKVGRRHYLIQVFDFTGAVVGNLLHQEEAFFDTELSTTTFTGSFTSGVFTPYSAFAPGDQFQKGSVKQPDLIVKGFFTTVA